MDLRTAPPQRPLTDAESELVASSFAYCVKEARIAHLERPWRGITADDRTSMCYMALCRAVIDYDESKGSWPAFAKSVVRYALISKPGRRDWRWDTTIEDMEAANSDFRGTGWYGGRSTPFGETSSEESERWTAMWDAGDEVDKNILQMLVRGLTQAQVGAMLGMTGAAVSWRTRRMLDIVGLPPRNRAK